MPPTAFGSLPPLAVPVVILGPLAFPLGIFAPCAFWLFGSAPFGSFLSCWALWALFGALWPSLCVFVPCGFVCPALGVFAPLCLFVVFALLFLGPFLLGWGFFGSPWGLLALFWASLCLVPFGFVCLALLVSVGFFCVAVGSSFWAPLAPCALVSCVPFGFAFFWAFCPSCLWPFGCLFFCACDIGARLWAFFGFALSFSLLPRSVFVPALACP